VTRARRDAPVPFVRGTFGVALQAEAAKMR
jgi:hypothetical protein